MVMVMGYGNLDHGFMDDGSQHILLLVWGFIDEGKQYREVDENETMECRYKK